MSAPQIYDELGKHAPRYRQSVNKALEILTECGLISKYYDKEKKALCYHLIKETYVLRITEMKIE
jgi:Fe2+ or Zn2+ uptake regulation protein